MAVVLKCVLQRGRGERERGERGGGEIEGGGIERGDREGERVGGSGEMRKVVCLISPDDQMRYFLLSRNVPFNGQKAQILCEKRVGREL